MHEAGSAGSSTATLVATFSAKTALETSVAEVTGGGDDSAAKWEDLALNKLSPEEVKKRRDEIMKMRNLLYYHELKQRRIKKIKSKEFGNRSNLMV